MPDDKEIVDGETTKNPDVPEEPPKETSEETPAETPEEPTKETTETDTSELEVKNRQLYERTKKAEEKAKLASEEVERLKKVPNATESGPR